MQGKIRDCELVLAPAVAFGQEIELGQLLDKGAVTLAKTDLAALIPGTTTKFTQWTTTSRRTVERRLQLGESRRAARPSVSTAAGPRMSANGTGTWSIADNGRYCWDIMINREWKACRFIFKVGDAYYMAPSANDRAAKAIPVKFEK